MIKFIFTLFLYLFLITGLKSEEINNISVEGNNRISDETIILFSNVNDLKVEDSLDLNQILKNLYSTNFFSDVSVNFKNKTLIISVVENPIIQTVEFRGIKNKTILKILNENIKLKEKKSFVKEELKNDEKNISNILRTNGFFFSTINSKIVENENNTVKLVFDIELGEKAYIKKIKFIGDKKIKDRKLKNVIVSEEAKFWKFISNRKLLDLKRIKLDESLLTNYYKNNGYYNVSVESSSAKIINDSDFELIFNINAGTKHYFNNLRLDIPEDFSKESFKNILSVLDKLQGKAYSLNRIEKILKEIDIIALDKEFEFINAFYNENIVDNNKIDLTIKLEQSEKFYVERINIFGNFITFENVIRNQLIIDEGDAYNEILLNKSINNLKAINIFSKVNAKISDGTSSKNKIVNINVEEKATGEIFAGAGTGTSGSSVAFGVKENNFLGKGIKLDTSATVSDSSVEFSFTSINPNFRNSDRSLKTSLENTSRNFMTRYGYKSTKTGFTFGTSFEQFRNVFFSPEISTYHETMKTSSSASTSRKNQEGDYLESTFNYGLTVNKLNQNFQPTDGYKGTFYQSIPVYSDDASIVNSYQFAKYFKLKDEMIFSVMLYGKAVNSLTGENVRGTKRIFIPSKKLRGFKIGKIGPVDSGDYIGGNYGSSINFATTFPQLFPDLQNMDFKLFLDAANLWGVDYDNSLDKSKLRTSAGFAVDWFTPIGPLNFSIAQPITKASTDVTEKFRFNIGTTF